jgi:hypothetical protein
MLQFVSLYEFIHYISLAYLMARDGADNDFGALAMSTLVMSETYLNEV